MVQSEKRDMLLQRHPSPQLGPLAIAFTVLFCAGLYPVTIFGGAPHFPGPSESAQTITTFFRLRPGAALLCAFLQFGSAVPLGIFTASITSRLHFLGVRAAGVQIALFGGFAAAAAVASSSMVLWTMTAPGIAQDITLTQALYNSRFPGFVWLIAAGFALPVGTTRPKATEAV